MTHLFLSLALLAFTGAQDFQINTLARTLPVKVLDLPGGTHVVREIVPAGWRLTGLTCTGNSTTSLATATATVTLAAGERVSCEFTDEKLGRIEIVKALRGESTTAFAFSVPATLDPAQGVTLTPPLDPGTATRVFENVPAGDYLVTENGPPNGWRLTSIDCQDPTGNTATNPADGGAFIRLAAGETVRCTWTNATNATIVPITSTLSASGSRNAPDRVVPCLRANVPSTQSDITSTIHKAVTSQPGAVATTKAI